MGFKAPENGEDHSDYLLVHGPEAKLKEINNLPFWWWCLTYACLPMLFLLVAKNIQANNFLIDMMLSFLGISFFSCLPIVLFLYIPKEMAMPLLKIFVSLVWLINMFYMMPENIVESISNFFRSLITVITAVMAIMIAMWLLFWERRATVVKEKPDHLGRQAANTVASKFSDSSGVWAGHAAHQDVFASVEDRGVVLGPPGSGKTAFLVAQLLKWAQTRRSFVCLDSKPEIFGATRQVLDQLGYRTLVYNPTAKCGQRYNPLTDIDSPEAVGELAAALVPNEDGGNTIFTESARDLLDAIISHLRAVDGEASLVSIRTLIASVEGYKGLLQILGNSPDPDAVDVVRSLAMTAANQRLLGSILGTLRANLRFLRYPNVRASLEVSDFSLADLGTSEPVALFLQFEEHQRETTAHLLAAMTGHLMRYLIRNASRPPVLLLLDEIGTVPVIPGLVPKLNTIRSRKLPTWTYWQSLEQMQRYGAKADEGANLILGACDYQMVFRLNDNASAKWMSDRIGVVDVTVRSESVGSEVVESVNLVTEPKIFPHELQQLRTGEVVCTYREEAWRGEATPYFHIWKGFEGKKPSGNQLYGDPYPNEARAQQAS